MVRPELIRYLVGPVPVLTTSALFLIASLSLSWTAQNNQAYGQWYTALLIVNIVGIGTLSIFFVANLLRLIRQFRKRVIGSRLMVRFVALFAALTLLPIAVIYYFAGQFVTKGVDSWFDVKIEQALDDASLLGKSFLEASKQTLIDNSQSDVARLALAERDIGVIRLLEEIRNQRQYQEVALFHADGRIIASSHINASVLVPKAPDAEDLHEAVMGSTKVKLEPFGDSLQYRLLAPVFSLRLSERPRVLQIYELLPLRYARLSESLQAASTEYSRLNYLRRPLKISFLVSLSLITLMTTLISLWLALYAARRLVAPIRDLAEGTQAVAAGDYQTQLTVKSGDEFGMLVTSFNTMTQKVRKAQSLARTNQRQAEDQRTYLQTVLAHLSSGVMSFDAQGTLLTANTMASNILGVALNSHLGSVLALISSEERHITPLLEAIWAGLESQALETGLEVQLGHPDVEGQTLSGGMTRIQQDIEAKINQASPGYVVVFDDVTKLIQAQREAAWGEVAQRLAHEIKNPLTPIQLSSERIRRKYLEALPVDQRDALDRSTRTIIEQVEAMKRMVDAFSNYARSTRLALEETEINRLIEDVVHLYRRPELREEFVLDLEEGLPSIQLDPDGLRQVLNNLISNARDATEALAERQISIHTSQVSFKQKKGIQILLSDNGPGYPEDMLDRIFEPYVTSKAKGTGLGMAIVKRIIDRHQGEISLRNHACSAEVTIWLPIQKPTAVALRL